MPKIVETTAGRPPRIRWLPGCRCGKPAIAGRRSCCRTPLARPVAVAVTELRVEAGGVEGILGAPAVVRVQPVDEEVDAAALEPPHELHRHEHGLPFSDACGRRAPTCPRRTNARTTTRYDRRPQQRGPPRQLRRHRVHRRSRVTTRPVARRFRFAADTDLAPGSDRTVRFELCSGRWGSLQSSRLRLRWQPATAHRGTRLSGSSGTRSRTCRAACTTQGRRIARRASRQKLKGLTALLAPRSLTVTQCFSTRGAGKRSPRWRRMWRSMRATAITR